MRTILYTGHDEAYKPLANITVPLMAEYAEHNGMDFTCYDKPLIDVPNGIYWTGVCGALKAFEEGYDRVMYLDVDQLITNKSIPPKGKIGFHVSKDWGTDATEPWHFSMCGFVAFKDMESFFKSILDDEPEWRDRPFPEQGTVQWWVKELIGTAPNLVHNAEKYEGLINIHPRKVFNCVPDQVCPGNVPEKWEVGDFAAHLTMKPLSERISIAYEILERNVKNT